MNKIDLPRMMRGAHLSDAVAQRIFAESVEVDVLAAPTGQACALAALHAAIEDAVKKLPDTAPARALIASCIAQAQCQLRQLEETLGGCG